MHRVVVIGLLMLQSVRALRLGSHRLALHNGAVSGVARAAGVGRLLSSVEDFFDNDSDSDRFVKRVDRRDRPARETVREDGSYGRGKEGSGARDGSWKQNDGAREYKPRYSAGTSDRHSGSTGGRGAPRPGQNSRPSYGSDRSGAGRDSGYRPAFNRPAGAGAGDNRRPTGGDYGNRSGSFNRFSKYKSDEEKEPPAYGYYDGDHLYGITPVRVALSTGRREIKELLVQSGMEVNNKKDDKFAKEILQLAKEKNIPIREFPKHDLNMLTDSRPHQGFVLRAEPLKFLRINNLEKTDSYQCVLALDEVWDPQNFGALLRTCYFLGCDKVVVCAKNSAPLSPSVSKASSGSMELLEIYSTDNMMKFLDKSRENGWQIVGTDLNEKSISLREVPMDVPTVLVLGNEGHGIRTNVLRRCTHLVRINGKARDSPVEVDEESASLVDSLNVSVTGGVILHHFLSRN